MWKIIQTMTKWTEPGPVIRGAIGKITIPSGDLKI